jgi:hypothetical protein
MISPLSTWPDPKQTKQWYAEVLATAGTRTVTILAKARNWVTFPTNSQFYFYSYNLSALPPSPAANMVTSKEVFTSNDVWTAFTLTFDAPAVDTYVPLYMSIKGYESDTADIVVDTTITEGN